MKLFKLPFLAFALVISFNALAQENEAENIEEVVVVGSQIKGARITGALPVSVISSVSSMEADALATALNVMGPVKGIEFANEKDLSVMYIMQGKNLIKSNKWDYND